MELIQKKFHDSVSQTMVNVWNRYSADSAEERPLSPLQQLLLDCLTEKAAIRVLARWSELSTDHWRGYVSADLPEDGYECNCGNGTLSCSKCSFVSCTLPFLEDHAADHARRVVELCQVFGLELTAEEQEIEYLKYLVTGLLGRTIKEIKFAINVAFCQIEDQEMPAGDEYQLGSHLFPRRLRVRLNLMKSKRDKKSVQSRLYTLFQGFKKGLQPMWPHEIENTLIKHQQRLQKDVDVPLDHLKRLSELTRELGFKWSNEDFKRKCPISRKATIQSSYAAGGTLGLLARLTVARGDEYGDLLYGEGVTVKQRMAIMHRLDLRLSLKVPELVGFYSVNGRSPEPLYSKYPLREELWEVLRTLETRLVCEAVPACILEPLKVRVITKPSAGLYTDLVGGQKRVWSFLRRFGPFSLIGEPLSKEHLSGMMSEWDVGKVFVSGDYEASTDNLAREASWLVCSIWSEDLDDETRDKVLNSMTRSRVLTSQSIVPRDTIPYEYVKLRHAEDLEMRNGQLMGNVLSFPALCWINYCALHISWEIYQNRTFPLFSREIPSMRVNGDDIAFCTDLPHVDIWKRVTTDFGLIPSVGKNFISDRFVQLNSEMWMTITQPRYDHEVGDFAYGSYQVRDYYRVNYLNFGLVTSRRKQDCSMDYSVRRSNFIGTLEDDSVPEWISRIRNVHSIYEKLMEGLAEVHLEKVALSLWQKHHRGFIEDLETLFMPQGSKRGVIEALYPGFGGEDDAYCRHLLRTMFSVGPNSSVVRLFPECEYERLLEKDLDKDPKERLRVLWKHRKTPYTLDMDPPRVRRA